MSATRASFKRIVLVFIVLCIVGTELGAHPLARSVDFRIQAPTDRGRGSVASRDDLSSKPSRGALRRIFQQPDASSGESSVTSTTTRCGEAFGYAWTVEAAAGASSERIDLAVRARKVGAMGLMPNRVFAYTVYTRTGVVAQRWRERVRGMNGIELPTQTETETALRSTTLSAQDLGAIPGVTGENGAIDLVIRVRVWSNPLHVLFKDEVSDTAAMFAVVGYMLVCSWRVASEMEHWRVKRRSARKVRLIKGDVTHKEEIHGDWRRLARGVAYVPLKTAFDASRLPLLALNSVSAAAADILVECTSLIWIAVVLLTTARRSSATEAPARAEEQEDRGKNHSKSKHGLPRHAAHRASNAHKSSTTTKLKDERVAGQRRKQSFATPTQRHRTEDDIIAELRIAEREAREAREHAEAMIRAHQAQMKLGSMRLRHNASSFSTHDRQESLELHKRQVSLIGRMLHDIEELDIPEDSTLAVPISEPSTPKDKTHTTSPSFSEIFGWTSRESDSF